MSSSITTFDFVAQSVRVVMIDNAPWFVAADVCSAIELPNITMALKRLDEDEMQVIDFATLNTIEGRENQQLSNFSPKTINIINESGLYSLILTSRKPEAKKFKKWVTSEVLPAIRKTGRYEAQKAAPMPVYISGKEESAISNRVWGLARPFYMDGSVRHWIYKYIAALAGTTRRQLIPASQYPEIIAMLNSLDAHITRYRDDRIQHEKEWLIRTLKRELDKRLGHDGPEFALVPPTNN